MKKDAIGQTTSGQPISPPDAPLYRERAKAPKWNIQPDATDYPRHLARRLPSWTKEDHTEAAALHLRKAAWYEASQRRLIDAGEAAHGAHGALISGGFRDHWPEDAKDRVRIFSRRTSAHRAAAWAHAKCARMRGIPRRSAA
jgi:hypothetical protein